MYIVGTCVAVSRWAVGHMATWREGNYINNPNVVNEHHVLGIFK